MEKLYLTDLNCIIVLLQIYVHQCSFLTDRFYTFPTTIIWNVSCSNEGLGSRENINNAVTSQLLFRTINFHFQIRPNFMTVLKLAGKYDTLLTNINIVKTRNILFSEQELLTYVFSTQILQKKRKRNINFISSVPDQVNFG